jgi:hypothetical protein
MNIPPAIAGLLIVTLVSTIGAWFLSAGKTVEKPVRAMLFVAYFRMLAFAQLLLFGLVYFIKQHI